MRRNIHACHMRRRIPYSVGHMTERALDTHVSSSAYDMHVSSSSYVSMYPPPHGMTFFNREGRMLGTHKAHKTVQKQRKEIHNHLGQGLRFRKCRVWGLAPQRGEHREGFGFRVRV
jgi:hypothetical protein